MLRQAESALWGRHAKLHYLIFAAAFLLFAFLGSRDLWTQEHRWADIVTGMFQRNDFWHPYLGQNQYYDKPLLSYWFIVAFTKILGFLNTWTLRLPSALAGLIAIFTTYRLGRVVKDKSLGLLGGWLLLTTFYFLFWARVSSADMLNLAGALVAITWYFEHKANSRFFDYMVFFLILALTSLCKGLVGAMIAGLAVLVDICLQRSWREHVNLKVFGSVIPAIILYLMPFILSSYFDQNATYQNGLYLVYRENILRFFEPFDHVGPLYTYLIYLPIYLFPWVFFFIPAICALPFRYKGMSTNIKWIVWTTTILFLFFTASGSRRSYYILPIIPYAILLTAEWVLSGSAKRKQWCTAIILIFYALSFVFVDFFPAWYYSKTGTRHFAERLQREAARINASQPWQYVLLDADAKLDFYLQLPLTTPHYDMKGERLAKTSTEISKSWPIVKNKPKHTIFITRKLYQPLLQDFFPGYFVLDSVTKTQIPFIKTSDGNDSVAFIPAT